MNLWGPCIFDWAPCSPADGLSHYLLAGTCLLPCSTVLCPWAPSLQLPDPQDPGVTPAVGWHSWCLDAAHRLHLAYTCRSVSLSLEPCMFASSMRPGSEQSSGAVCSGAASPYALRRHGEVRAFGLGHASRIFAAVQYLNNLEDFVHGPFRKELAVGCISIANVCCVSNHKQAHRKADEPVSRRIWRLLCSIPGMPWCLGVQIILEVVVILKHWTCIMHLDGASCLAIHSSRT